MDFIKNLPQVILSYTDLKIILCLLSALFIAHISIPSIVNIARKRNLFDEPKARGAHDVRTPTFGGTAIYGGMLIASMIFMNLSLPQTNFIQYVIAGSLIIFLIGLKDDILSISPRNKLIGQFFAAGILIDMGDVRFTDLHGFLGIHHIGYISSAILTLFVIIVIINAFNLIDGVDGLASGVGIVTASTFGGWFYLIGQHQLAILAFSLVGGLIGFFYFNVFSKKNKIFMGDTGSLILGYFMSIFTIKFNELNVGLDSSYLINAAPAVSISILIVPIFDTARVFLIRILRKKSPFSPDKNHIHHRLLRLYGDHRRTSFTIIIANILFVCIGFSCKDMNISLLILILLTLASGLSILPLFIIQKREIREKLQAKENKAA
ncbi:MAG: glycosyltransferase family 4 protein [Hyphomicrobiales bacterium]